ncbi:MAG: DUF2779 domain-containing protein [Anaerolineae bacterium]|nr:MAG: DUF2779 domain-containing protein [Anaerolineae bacterium]
MFMPLTKTDFLLYLDAPNHLWAKANGQMPDEPPSANALHLMRQGLAIEPLARQYLEEIILPKNGGDLSWQATHGDERFEIRVDALVRAPATGDVDLYEIKAVTGVQPEHLIDVAFQSLVLRQRLPLRRLYLVILNKEYRRAAALDAGELFVTVDVTEEAAALFTQVEAWREEALAVLGMDSVPMEGYCLKPADCPCPAVCHPGLPEFSIYDVPRLNQEKKRQLRAGGVLAAKDIPDGFALSDKQQQHVRAAKDGKATADGEAIRKILDGLKWPLWFLDYETYNSSLPLFSGYRPYEPVVFQVSVHALLTVDAELSKHEFLGSGPEDPARLLVESLTKFGELPGTVVVWNQSFEMSRNREMAERYPEWTEYLGALNARVFDLMTVFSQQHFVHPGFRGSNSIKRVLPALIPGFSYEGLAVADGSQAMLAWYGLFSGQEQGAAREKTKQNLLDYCRLDTLAMVEIYRFLHSEFGAAD